MMVKTRKKTKNKKVERGPNPTPLTLMQLCARSGGRCQFRGCNKLLFRDAVTFADFNNTNVVHIVASRPTGPRGDSKRSYLLSNKLSNLMLMCPDHHHLIDHEAVEMYSEEVLRAMKEEQERNVERVCEALNSEETHLLSLRSKIRGDKEVTIERDQMLEAILPEKRPAGGHRIALDIDIPHFYRSPEFWRDAQNMLKHKFDRFVGSVVETDKSAHFSVFPLAPIPLIIKFGYMMGDKIRADVYQKRREPDTWKWQEGCPRNSFLCRDHDGPMLKGKDVSLVISLSAWIAESCQIEFAKLVGSKKMYELYATKPGLNCISSKDDITAFWYAYQRIMEMIHQNHPRCKRISVLVAAPVSAAFEIGRRYMPGIYPIMDVYEQHHSEIFKTIEIGGEND